MPTCLVGGFCLVVVYPRAAKESVPIWCLVGRLLAGSARLSMDRLKGINLARRAPSAR